jgi:penicillin-binding protein 1A
VKALSFALKFVLTIALGAAALAGSVALLAPASRSLESAAPPLGHLDLKLKDPAARSIVYDRFGGFLTSFSTQDRSPVQLRQVPKVLIDAVLSIEDRKFYEHHGVDWGGTARALFKNVDVGGIAQGGSTITQQLVKNALSTNRKRDLKTKLREAILAMRLEHEMSKDEILEDYLNLVYFGNGAYGVQAAAERYYQNPFNPKPLQHLSLAQAALLAGLIQSPEALNPIKHPDLAARRRSEVLDAMVANHKITEKQAARAKKVPLPTKLSYPVATAGDYYEDEVKNQLLRDDPNVAGDPGELLGNTAQARAAAVFRGGLKIYTAYDPYMQYAAGLAMAQELPKNTPFTASLVVVDNADGGVRAMVNGQSFAQSQFNPATEGLGRQAGSSFKVFTTAAALSRGYSPHDSVSGSSITWRIGPGSGSDAFYNVHTDCGHSGDFTSALGASDNCAFVRTELSLGPGNYGHDGAQAVVDMAHAMGIESKLDPVVSTTLGTNGVHPLEMAQAYSTIASDGVAKHAAFITKIVGPTGKVIYQNTDTGHRVLDVQVAREEQQMMFAPVRSGTASKTLGNFPRPIAGKTGTTDKSVDAWFVGFAPQLTAAVWMGNPDGEIKMVIGGRQVFGADYPAKIWRAFMLSALSSLPVVQFTPPDRALIPRASYISETGRRPTFGFNTAPATTVPATVPVTTPTPTTSSKKPVITTPHTRPSPPTTAEPPPTTSPVTSPGP